MRVRGSAEDRLLLHERHLVSKELAGLDPQHPVRSGAAVFLGDGMGVMVNEEDHLRLQALRSGFDLGEAYSRAVYLEWLCEVHLRATAAGMPRLLSLAEIDRVRQKIATYGVQPVEDASF